MAMAQCDVCGNHYDKTMEIFCCGHCAEQVGAHPIHA